MNQIYSLGIDIGGTNTDIGLVNGTGTVISRTNLKTFQYSDPQLYVNDIVKAIKELTKDILPEKITGVGIGAPAANYYTGSIENATNLNMKGIIPLRTLLRYL